jgi:hypothetical protein
VVSAQDGDFVTEQQMKGRDTVLTRDGGNEGPALDRTG